MIKGININLDRCIHCGMCIKDCMLGCLEFDENKTPHYGPVGEDRCVLCQHCMMVCPKGALTVGDKNPDNSSAPEFCNSEDMFNHIKSRRSIRKFKSQNVPEDILAKLMEMLAYAPTGGNLKALHFAVVDGKEKIAELQDLTYDALGKIENPDYITQLCLNMRTAGEDLIYRNAPAMIVASVNKAIAAPNCITVDPIISLSYFEMMAESLGLGTLWNGIATNMVKAMKPVQDKLLIPEGYEPSFILSFGLPAIRYPRNPQKDPAYITLI